jgi:hypothetical protein
VFLTHESELRLVGLSACLLRNSLYCSSLSRFPPLHSLCVPAVFTCTPHSFLATKGSSAFLWHSFGIYTWSGSFLRPWLGRCGAQLKGDNVERCPGRECMFSEFMSGPAALGPSSPVLTSCRSPWFLRISLCVCGLVVRVPGCRTEMYCVSCEVRT